MPYTASQTATPGQLYAAGRGYRIACSAAGYFRLILSNGSTYDVFATVGQGGEDGIAVVGCASAGVPSPAGAGSVQILNGPAV